LEERIKDIRIALGWNKAELAQKAGVSQSVINAIETGKNTNPSIKTLWKLSHAMDMSVSELLNIESIKRNL